MLRSQVEEDVPSSGLPEQPEPTTFEGVQERGGGGWEPFLLKAGAAEARVVGRVHLSSLHVVGPLPCTLIPR